LAPRDLTFMPRRTGRCCAAILDAASLDDRRARPGSLALAGAMITDRHLEAVEAFLSAGSIERATIDLIGFHGQTVLHGPTAA
jgi:anhydro-N-acetylmuramic acid kinase